MSSSSGLPSFIMPNLISSCYFPLSVSIHADKCRATDQWIDIPGALSERARAKVTGLDCGLLGAMVYPNADPVALQICTDYCNFLFHLDDLTDEMGVKDNQLVKEAVMNVLYKPEEWREGIERGDVLAVSRLMYDIWGRMLPTAGPNVKRRFTETFSLFFQCTEKEAAYRASGKVLDIDTYIVHRRDSGAVKPCFVLIEFAAGMDLPEDVIQHPIIRSLEDGANDMVGWVNDVLSYNVEQARGDSHNLVAVVMKEKGLGVQEAFDFVGEMYNRRIDQFSEDRTKLPSWGPEMDRAVNTYVDGLQDWVIGLAHWSFATQRYFGTDGPDVKKHGRQTLLPKRQLA